MASFTNPKFKPTTYISIFSIFLYFLFNYFTNTVIIFSYKLIQITILSLDKKTFSLAQNLYFLVQKKMVQIYCYLYPS